MAIHAACLVLLVLLIIIVFVATGGIEPQTICSTCAVAYIILTVFDFSNNSTTSQTITIRIYSFAHRIIIFCIIQKC